MLKPRTARLAGAPHLHRAQHVAEHRALLPLLRFGPVLIPVCGQSPERVSQRLHVFVKEVLRREKRLSSVCPRGPGPRPLPELTHLRGPQSSRSSAQGTTRISGGLAPRDEALAPRQNPTRNPDRARCCNGQRHPPASVPDACGKRAALRRATHYRGSEAQGVRHTWTNAASTLSLPRPNADPHNSEYSDSTSASYQ